MRTWLALLLLLVVGSADAQTPTAPPTVPPVSTTPNSAAAAPLGAVQATNPALPPGLPSPSLAPIGPEPKPNSLSPNTAKAATTTVATPSFEPPAEELGPNDIGLENADEAIFNDDGTDTVSGNIRLRYRNYTLQADKATIDSNEGVATLTGHVRLTSDKKDVVVNSLTQQSKLTINLRQGTYTVVDGNAVLAPSAIPQVTGLLLPLRLYGGDINAAPQLIDARDTSATTCDFANPHYFFKARRTVIIPGKRLVARYVTLYRRHRKIITIPYLLFPLDNRYLRQGLTPEVGYDPVEGYFAKFATPYVLAAAAVGILRLDLMSREGIGTGFNQSFSTGGSHTQNQQQAAGGASTVNQATNPLNGPTLNSLTGTPSIYGNGISSGGLGIFGRNALQGGTIQIYHLADSSAGMNTTTGSLTDSQTLFHNIRLSIDSQFQNDSYLSSASSSSAISGQFAISRVIPGANTSLTTNIQESNYGLGNSQTVTSSVMQQNALSKITSLTTKLDFSQFTTPAYSGLSGTYQNSFATNFDLTSHPKGYQLELQANTFAASSSVSGETITGGVQRLPELTLESVPTPSDRLLPGLLPALAKYILDLGQFNEASDKMEDLRAEMGLDLGGNTDKHMAITTGYSGSFLQYFYSDNTARYILQDQLNESYAFQKQSTVGLNYSYLRPYGYTPFLFDQTGSFNNLNFNVNYQPTKRLLTTVSSGFDIGQDHSIDGIPATPWLDINGQIQYTIDKLFINVLNSSYDPNRGLLFNVSDTTRMALPWGFAFNSGINYVPQNGKFSNVNVDFDLPIVTDKREQAGYRFRLLTSYDGETDTFNYQALELTRSWHDWELSGIYQDNTTALPGSSFYINFRLKAFPGYEPFGTGQFGQGLDTGTGQVL